MRNINYDFSEFTDIFVNMIERGTPIPSELYALKKALNKFFKDSECIEVLYTNNSDKMFFGMKVIPMIDVDDIYEYLIEDEPKRLGKYIIEIDSHLLNPVLDLYSRELMAIMLHEVGHLVGDSRPIEEARDILNSYMVANKDTLKISQSIHYRELLAYGLKDYLSKSNSMFYNPDESEIYADEFATVYGFSTELTSAYRKISINNTKLYENTNVAKSTVFCWTLNLYKNLRVRRISAVKTLNRAIQLTGSRIEKMEMENVIKRIKRIDDDTLLENKIFNEDTSSIRAKLKEKMRKSRLNNLRTIDNTYYELAMQVRNVEDEDDALYLMRQINNSISIMEDYASSPDCDDYEKDKWNQCILKFTQLRDKLSSTIVYKNKSYGLFVNYPDIVENRY